MNREQFIAQLARLLQDLPPAERQEAIRYYQEYFDDAGEENEDVVIQELGSPGKVVASIKANLQYGGSTFGANDTDMENTGTESQTKDADGWQNADTQGQSGQQQTWQKKYAKPVCDAGEKTETRCWRMGTARHYTGLCISDASRCWRWSTWHFYRNPGNRICPVDQLFRRSDWNDRRRDRRSDQRDPSCDQFTGSRTGKHGRRSDLHRTGNLMRSIFPVVYLSAVSACITYHAEFYLKNRT